MKLNDSVLLEIRERIMLGMSPRSASIAAGYTAKQFRNWSRSIRFWNEMQRFQKEAEEALLKVWLAGDPKGVGYGPARAACDLLSRTSKRYRPKKEIDLAGEYDAIIRILEDNVDSSTFTKLMMLIESQVGDFTDDEKTPKSLP